MMMTSGTRTPAGGLGALLSDAPEGKACHGKTDGGRSTMDEHTKKLIPYRVCGKTYRVVLHSICSHGHSLVRRGAFEGVEDITIARSTLVPLCQRRVGAIGRTLANARSLRWTEVPSPATSLASNRRKTTFIAAATVQGPVHPPK